MTNGATTPANESHELRQRQKEAAAIFVLHRDEAEPGTIIRPPTNLLLTLTDADGKLHGYWVNGAVLVKYAKGLADLVMPGQTELQLDAAKCSAQGIEAIVRLIMRGFIEITDANAANVQNAAAYLGIGSQLADACAAVLSKEERMQMSAAQRDQLEKLMANVRAEWAALEETMPLREAKLDELKRNHVGLTGQPNESWTSLGAVSVKAAVDLTALRAELKKLEANKEQLTAELAEVRDENARELAELQDKCEQTKFDHGELAGQLAVHIAGLIDGKSKAKLKIESLAAQNGLLKGKKQQLVAVDKALHKALEESRARLSIRVDGLEQELADREHENMRRQNANDELNEQLSVDKAALTHSETAQYNLSQELEACEAELELDRSSVVRLIQESRPEMGNAAQYSRETQSLRAEIRGLEDGIEEWDRTHATGQPPRGDEMPASCHLELLAAEQPVSRESPTGRVRNTSRFRIWNVKPRTKILLTGLFMGSVVHEMRNARLGITEFNYVTSAYGAYKEYVLIPNADGFVLDNYAEHELGNDCKYRFDLSFKSRSPGTVIDWPVHNVVAIESVFYHAEAADEVPNEPGDNGTPLFLAPSTLIAKVLLKGRAIEG